MEDRLAYLELDYGPMADNRRAHLLTLEAKIPTTTHPIDLENLLMSINSTKAIITFCEGVLKLPNVK